MIVTAIGTAVLGASCTSRPIITNAPELQTNIAVPVVNSQIDKIDLLFDIDNSASMGDKQHFLSQAIPDLIGRLIQPNCISVNGGTYKSTASPTATPSCAENPADQLEFPAVHDLHVAVVSSSLGQRGGGMCNPSGAARRDDHGHLLGNSTPGWRTSVADLTSSDFLAWYPTWPSNSGRASADSPLETNPSVDAGLPFDFSEIVTDVGAEGCGIESQLESWYRFLIQPDPYESIDSSTGHAVWSDAIDSEILTQRAAFLRPDSLVAVIVLTDENDSEVDVRSFNGQSFEFMNQNSPLFEDDAGGDDFQPCKAPAICATSPNDPNCTWAADSHGNCLNGQYSNLNDWGYDGNLRHVHMKQKYGIDPQFPISRYVTGLTSKSVPDRMGEYPTQNAPYQGENNCLNPLFAAKLSPPSGAALTYSANAAQLCNKGGATGPRTADMVFYAIIGGVPYQDLHYPSPSVDGGPVDWSSYELTDKDWQWIVGKNPEAYDFSGIDPHMVEDFKPRQHPTFPVQVGTAPPDGDVGATATLGSPSATVGSGWDPINGREWSTDDMPTDGGVLPLHFPNGLNVDRQYACIFQLPEPRNCAASPVPEGCECLATGLSHEQTSPLCDDPNINLQTYAKAYPTTRELLVARDLAAVPGANAGVVSSICPVHVVDNATGTDPFYGYRPAMAAIIHKLSQRLQTQCIPPLEADPAGQVPCLLLAVLPSGEPASTCENTTGLAAPDPKVLAPFEATNAIDPTTAVVCAVNQTPVAAGASCASNATDPGWCYVTPDPATQPKCSQEIIVSDALKSGPLANATIYYQCIETSARDAGH